MGKRERKKESEEEERDKVAVGLKGRMQAAIRKQQEMNATQRMGRVRERGERERKREKRGRIVV